MRSLCLQIRDFDAILRSRRADKGPLIIKYLQHAYMLHYTVKTGGGYSDCVFLQLLQLDYLARVDHPAYKTFLLDANIAVEEDGEITLSQLSNKMLHATNKSEYLALLKAYDFVGTGGELTKDMMQSLGISTRKHMHCSSDKQHKSTVEAIEPHLKKVAKQLIRDGTLSTFSVDDEGITFERINSGVIPTPTDTFTPLYPVGEVPTMDVHYAGLRNRYVNNVMHPSVGGVLRGIVNDDRYIGR